MLDAFAADGTPEAQFALPEFGEGAMFPGEMAMGFHFVDYVVHGWDVAASLDFERILRHLGRRPDWRGGDPAANRRGVPRDRRTRA